MSEIACVYAALALADAGVEITADKLVAMTKAAGVEVQPIWASLFAKFLEGKDVMDMLSNVGSGSAAAAPAAAAGAAATEEAAEEEAEESESDSDMGFDLFG
ncbi:Ribosomal protein L10/L12 [Carpediemonas membranifera]|uniref:Ribosomal protein L10/L12 n=1 Tax=Carpediemonas membranifera TaxID=201153 RepID=A0A8J6E087_9EUKA|nr:Ribosomal protein L10/L12 [Carpediemonas membranifera]|eukprot:KAG9394734.1 Ribosomal protein L10/L12 [Carpediemonas membranifera]